MTLFIKECKNRVWLLLLSAISFELCRYAFKSNDNMELNYYVFPVIFCTLLFIRRDEIELIQTTRTRLTKVLASRYMATYLLLVLYPVLRLLATRQPNAEWISLSMATTLIFCTSFSMLFRILFRNPYGAVIMSVITHIVMVRLLDGLLGLFLSDRAVRRLSPYFSTSIANKGLYANNRMIVTGIAVLILGVGFIILYRREKILME